MEIPTEMRSGRRRPREFRHKASRWNLFMLGRVHIRGIHTSLRNRTPSYNARGSQANGPHHHCIEMIWADVGKGPIAAIPTLFPNVVVQPLRKSDQAGSQSRP